MSDIRDLLNKLRPYIAGWTSNLLANGLPSAKIGDVSGGNYLAVETDGTLALYGNATAWDDFVVDPVARTSGTKTPNFGAFRSGLYTYLFDDALVAQEKEIYFNVQMPHRWKAGSTVYPHVHWSPLVAGSAGNKVRWGLEYSVAALGGAYPTSTTIYADTPTLGNVTVQYDHCLTPFAGVAMTGMGISTVILCRLFRNSSDAADTLAQTVGLLSVDFHYEIDSLGSRTEFVK